MFKMTGLMLCCFAVFSVKAQTDSMTNRLLTRQKDFKDIEAYIFRLRSGPDTANVKKMQKSILPAFGYNPSAGFEMGFTMSSTRHFGNADNTNLSNASIGGYASTKGLASIQLKHNIYLPGNRWSFQGAWEFGRTLALDYGVGTGRRTMGEDGFSLNSLPLDNSSDVFPLKFVAIRLRERVFKQLAKDFYGGIGLSVNSYSGIDDERNENNQRTHHYRYSRRNEFSPDHYFANGISINFQFDTRDHPNRPYRGLYADLSLKTNQKLLGSTARATQLRSEIRKYWSLSKKNPGHMIAFWHWGNYLLNGKLPYLELPGTGADTYNRSGRAYINGRFKGQSFFYSETEYRFPISRNGFCSGVTFVNAQSASNAVVPVKLFKYWEPGGGAGLRFLFNKQTRSNICFDYGIGRNGASGLYVRLNEAF